MPKNKLEQKNTKVLPKVVVLGIGNLLLKDEGVGVHLLHLLETTDLNYPNMELIDAGTSVDIPLILDKMDKLIILDAVNGGKEAGTIYHFTLEKINSKENNALSFHQMGILESLKTLDLLGKKPKSTVVIGIEPKLIDWGMELSPEIEDKLPQMLQLIKREINVTSEIGRGYKNDSV